MCWMFVMFDVKSNDFFPPFLVFILDAWNVWGEKHQIQWLSGTQIQPLQGANFPSRWVYHGTIYHIAIRAPKGIKFPTHGRINYTIPRLN